MSTGLPVEPEDELVEIKSQVVPVGAALVVVGGAEFLDETTSGKSDGEQALLSHLAQLVKANR